MKTGGRGPLEVSDFRHYSRYSRKLYTDNCKITVISYESFSNGLILVVSFFRSPSSGIPTILNLLTL